jgi:hypothetical protein
MSKIENILKQKYANKFQEELPLHQTENEIRLKILDKKIVEKSRIE